MGIRINKAIGYGLDDINPNLAEDPRLNLSEEKLEELEDHYDNFIDFLSNSDTCINILVNNFYYKEQEAKLSYLDTDLCIQRYKQRKTKPTISNVMCYDESESFLLFVPLGHAIYDIFSSWIRHNDTIDYYEHYADRLENSITNLSECGVCGIYPYSSSMYLKPGRTSLISNNITRLEAGHYNQLLGRWDLGTSGIIKDQKIIQHLKEDWYPKFPSSILLFTHYFNIFKTPDTIFDLKPLLCKWWE